MIKTLIKSPEELGVGEQELLWVLIDDISRGQFCKLYKKVFNHILWPSNYHPKETIKCLLMCMCIQH